MSYLAGALPCLTVRGCRRVVHTFSSRSFSPWTSWLRIYATALTHDHIFAPDPCQTAALCLLADRRDRTHSHRSRLTCGHFFCCPSRTIVARAHFQLQPVRLSFLITWREEEGEGAPDDTMKTPNVWMKLVGTQRGLLTSPPLKLYCYTSNTKQASLSDIFFNGWMLVNGFISRFQVWPRDATYLRVARVSCR